MAVFDDLSLDIVVSIFQLVSEESFEGVFSLQQCCKKFYQASYDPFFLHIVPLAALLSLERVNSGWEEFFSHFFRARNLGAMTEVTLEVFFTIGIEKLLHFTLSLLKHVALTGLLEAAYAYRVLGAVYIGSKSLIAVGMLRTCARPENTGLVRSSRLNLRRAYSWRWHSPSLLRGEGRLCRLGHRVGWPISDEAIHLVPCKECAMDAIVDNVLRQ